MQNRQTTRREFLRRTSAAGMGLLAAAATGARPAACAEDRDGAFPQGKADHFKQYTDTTGDVPELGDCMWVGSWPSHMDTMPEDLTGEIGYPVYPHQGGRFMGRFCIDRHKNAINVGFVDTHAERVPLKDLWLIKWHRNFIPTTTVVIQ